MSPPPAIGLRMRYAGTTHRGLRGCTVLVVAVLKRGEDGDDERYLRTHEAVAAAGGLEPGDRLEVRPFLPDGRLSFVASDAAPEDLHALGDPDGDENR